MQLTVATVTSTFAGTDSYPSLGCQGDLDLRSVSPSVLSLTEYITQGSNCVNGGQITMTLVGHSAAEFSWVSPGASGLTASGAISKS